MSKAIGILTYALAMEKQGHEFFKEKAKVFSDPTTRELFEKLAQVELEHYRLIEQELKAYTDNPEEYKVSAEVLSHNEESIFSAREQSESLDTTLVESDVPDLTVMRMAYLIERDYKEFYQDAVDMVEEQNVKDLLTRLSNWELGHERLFKHEYDRLKKEYMTLPWGG